ncbi:HD-GYP domain-containing protein [Candidatus Fermentibacteria bacterium]|nr:HD-GYP domain-containing protein [Candidatus Fermentibacteria bacterium]
MHRRLPPTVLLTASAALGSAVLLLSGAEPPMFYAFALSIFLRAFPCWREDGFRGTLDAVPRLLMFAVAPFRGLAAGALSIAAGESLAALSGQGGRGRFEPLLTALASATAVPLAFASPGSPIWIAASLALLHAGPAAAGSLAEGRMPGKRFLVSGILTLAAAAPLAWLILQETSLHGVLGTVMTSIPLAAFTAFAAVGQKNLRAYQERTTGTAVQNTLSAELSASRSIPEFMGILAGYLSGADDMDLVLLTRQSAGQGWIGWTVSSQLVLPEEETAGAGSVVWNELGHGASIRGTRGCLLGLSPSGDMVLFVSGRAWRTIRSMDVELRSNLVSLISHSWQAVGNSMTIDEAFIAAAIMLARLADSKDDYTHGHSLRVARLSDRLGRRLGLSPARLRTLRVGALLHDLGKVAIPTEILTKRGLLTRDERAVIEKHPSEGARILGALKGYDEVRAIVSCHHERLDGKGYPGRLFSRDIPFLARIVAVADTFDAITSRRSYRADADQKTALEAIRAASGTQFDAKVVGALEEMLDDVARDA